MVSANITKSFFSFRTSESLTRFLVQSIKEDNKESSRLVLKSSLTVDIATAVFSFIAFSALAPLIAFYVAGGKDALHVYWIFGVSILFGFADQTWFSVARERRILKLISGLQIAASASLLLGTVVLRELGVLNLSSMSALYLVVAAGTCAANFWQLKSRIRREYGIKLDLRFPKEVFDQRERLRDFWRVMRNSYLSSMVSSVVKNGDVLILGCFRQDAEVGVYRLAKNLVASIQSTTNFISLAIYQDFNELVSENRKGELKAVIAKTTKILAPVILLGILIAVVGSQPAIEKIYGTQFKEAYPAFVILISGVGVAMALFWVQPLGLAMDCSKGFLKLSFIQGALAVVTMAVLASLYGAIGVAMAVSLAWLGGVCGMLLIVLRKMRYVWAR